MILPKLLERHASYPCQGLIASVPTRGSYASKQPSIGPMIYVGAWDGETVELIIGDPEDPIFVAEIEHEQARVFLQAFKSAYYSVEESMERYGPS